ncbi:hypothetical protein F9278_45430 [Streptomyces phaeolivaceus]|uniref:Uncharacterized protein n=1 Tax=Streptomyces phaeolivaceus TaxID=2653200 RepID=A0A5P8KHW4_9ACTN|nr:hypothetical protein [Streptomyces phaeolivaceus]QFR02198.1 hypothetical protein F9278_45430 [Streptomyces phaeolivaceus]
MLLSAGGCSDGDDGTRASSAPPAVSASAATRPGSETPSSSPSESPYSDNDQVLMARGDCYGSSTDDEPGRALEMACGDPDAIGKVQKRVKEKTTANTSVDCPDSADDVLGIRDDLGP